MTFFANRTVRDRDPGARSIPTIASRSALACDKPDPRIGRSARVSFAAFGLAALALASGCGSLSSRPSQPVLYDFGAGSGVRGSTAAPAPAPALAGNTAKAAVALAEIEASSRLEGTQVLYRLGYADPNEVRPYAHARWSVAPAQLVQSRLRDALAMSRTVLSTAESAALARTQGQRPRTLRTSLEEFTHHFENSSSSAGLVRLRATLVESTPGGERVVAQSSFTALRPASSANAAGGVKALAAASDAVIAELIAWIDRNS